MASTSSPYGLRPVFSQSGQVRREAYDNLLLSGMNVPIYLNTPVKLVIGTGASVAGVTVATGQMVIQPAAAQSDAICGVFAGVEYQDANGRGQYSPFWSSGLTLYTNTVARVYLIGPSDPYIIYQAQFDGAISTATLPQNIFNFLGKQASFNSSDLSATAPAGSINAGGLSSARVSATLTSTGSQGQLRIVNNPVGQPVSTPIDAFPELYFQIARHQFLNPQTSL